MDISATRNEFLSSYFWIIVLKTMGQTGDPSDHQKLNSYYFSSQSEHLPILNQLPQDVLEILWWKKWEGKTDEPKTKA